MPRLARRDQRDTKDRLVAAATTLFAERGFHGTTVRDIAERAGANVAAGNYHYGSKKALYLEVLRAQFAEVRALLDAQGANPAPAAFARLDRDALTRILRTRVRRTRTKAGRSSRTSCADCGFAPRAASRARTSAN